MLLPYIFYFAVFIVYVTYVHKNKVQNGENYTQPYGIAQIICIIICLLSIIYQGFYEAKQIWYNRLYYFMSFWNLVDLISLLLNFTVCISDLAGIEDVRFVPLSAVAVLFMYLKLFYFGRIFIMTAAMVRMVIAIIYDMRYFLMVFLLACAGFGNCFFILAKNDTSNGIFTGDTYFKAFLYSYRQALGAFDVSAYDAVADKHLLYFIWFFNTLILFIILLNMIVAVMGDTFDKVQETAVNNILKEIVSIMYENELLLNNNNMFKDAQYLIVIQEERADEEVEVEWDGKLKRIKKHLEGVVGDQNKILKELENHIDDTFRRKIEQKTKDMESNADKNFMMLDAKAEFIDKLITKCMNGLEPEVPEENKNSLQKLFKGQFQNSHQ